ncbi:hypothetical protein N8D56_24605 [Devosia sp. A8/3-2]|nr:hypothetical protein N8D56_24605 [Devosia sp. A8/3-2]
MARAYQTSDITDPDNEPRAGDWQALRGEVVALLDQVEGRYATERVDPALSGLSQRVRNLRDRWNAPNQRYGGRRPCAPSSARWTASAIVAWSRTMIAIR